MDEALLFALLYGLLLTPFAVLSLARRLVRGGASLTP
jgi:hypothetical protein